MDKYNGCISYDSGTFDLGQKSLNFTQHRKICKDKSKVSFEYGQSVGKDYYLIVGVSIMPSTKIENIKFMALTYLNGKKIGEKKINYSQAMNLLQKNDYKSFIQSSPKAIKPPTKTPVKALEASSTKRALYSTAPVVTPKQPVKLTPGSKENHVINPLTNKEILIGGPTYQQLCSSGSYIC